MKNPTAPPKVKPPRKSKRTIKSQDKPPSWAAAEIHEMMRDLDPPEPETEGEEWFRWFNPDYPRSIYEINPNFPMSADELRRKRE
jgi:hypothetical protein